MPFFIALHMSDKPNICTFQLNTTLCVLLVYKIMVIFQGLGFQTLIWFLELCLLFRVRVSNFCLVSENNAYYLA